MSYHFLDDKDPRIDVMFQGLEKMEKMLSVIEKMPKSLFNGERFLTDEELSKVLRVSRRTLQEYRTFGVVPLYISFISLTYSQREECSISTPYDRIPALHRIM